MSDVKLRVDSENIATAWKAGDVHVRRRLGQAAARKRYFPAIRNIEATAKLALLYKDEITHAIRTTPPAQIKKVYTLVAEELHRSQVASPYPYDPCHLSLGDFLSPTEEAEHWLALWAVVDQFAAIRNGVVTQAMKDGKKTSLDDVIRARIGD